MYIPPLSPSSVACTHTCLAVITWDSITSGDSSLEITDFPSPNSCRLPLSSPVRAAAEISPVHMGMSTGVVITKVLFRQLLR